MINTDYQYYYNNVPGKGQCRNNLVYTSLINRNKIEFVQWFFNDTFYHNGHNQVMDTELMNEKWLRETNMLLKMHSKYPQHIPAILDIDYANKKIHLGIEGVDFWEQSHNKTYEDVLPNWKEQMLEIIQAHKDIGMYKYSLHPSSYFVVEGRLKSINYFFSYMAHEPKITVRDHLSHISNDRKVIVYEQMKAMNIDVNSPVSFDKAQLLCFESFRNNYPDDFIDQAISIYK